jgi:hypothetical protein
MTRRVRSRTGHPSAAEDMFDITLPSYVREINAINRSSGGTA